MEYEKGNLIYAQGDPPDAFYCLLTGRVRVFAKDSLGQSQTLEVLHRGDYFGMVSLLTSEPHSVTARGRLRPLRTIDARTCS